MLGMKDFNILRVHWKIQLLGAGGVGGLRKTNIERGLPKMGAWKVWWFIGALARKRGVWYPNAHYATTRYLLSLKKSRRSLSKFPDISFWVNLFHVAPEKLMAGRYSSLWIKWHSNLKNRKLQVVFWKKSIVFTKYWCFKNILLTVAVPKYCSTPKEN